MYWFSVVYDSSCVLCNGGSHVEFREVFEEDLNNLVIGTCDSGLCNLFQDFELSLKKAKFYDTYSDNASVFVGVSLSDCKQFLKCIWYSIGVVCFWPIKKINHIFILTSLIL